MKRGREGENSLESELYYIYFPWLEVLGIILTLCHTISVIKLNQNFFERHTVWGHQYVGSGIPGKLSQEDPKGVLTKLIENDLWPSEIGLILDIMKLMQFPAKFVQRIKISFSCALLGLMEVL